ncbi:hypothetical protein [Pseudomonas helleri]|uniref:hypothetical protein n=1 Tax=Pseudomonas helleri TaxID=1608996 RepID=UPI001296C09A|nr:hypothetical protein [Pseudomonas helleri]MQT33863.1 hypothetical protein [Pseudomonas helleri]
MALQTDVVFNGVTIQGAYVAVVMPCIRMNKVSMSFCVHYKNGRYGDVIAAQDMDASYDIEGSNPFKQAYVFLKADMPNAIDVLEDGQ